VNENRLYCNEDVNYAAHNSKLKLSTLLSSPCWKPSIASVVHNSLQDSLMNYRVMDLTFDARHRAFHVDISALQFEDMICTYSLFMDVFVQCSKYSRRNLTFKNEDSAQSTTCRAVVPLTQLNNNFFVQKAVADNSIYNLIQNYGLEHGNYLSVIVPRERFVCNNRSKLDDSQLFVNKGCVVGLHSSLKSDHLTWKPIKVRWFGSKEEKDDAMAPIKASPLLSISNDLLNPWEIYKINRNNSKVE
jgi:hypothetical protein